MAKSRVSITVWKTWKGSRHYTPSHRLEVAGEFNKLEGEEQPWGLVYDVDNPEVHPERGYHMGACGYSPEFVGFCKL